MMPLRLSTNQMLLTNLLASVQRSRPILDMLSSFQGFLAYQGLPRLVGRLIAVRTWTIVLPSAEA